MPALNDPQKEKVALLLAEGATNVQAASAVNRGESTIRAWKRDDPEFAARVRELRTNITQEATDVFRSHLKEYAETIDQVARGHIDDEAGARVRFAASRYAIDLVLKPVIQDELSRRIDRPEDKAAREAAAAPYMLSEQDLMDLTQRGVE